MQEQTIKKYQSLSKGLGVAGLIISAMTLLLSLIPFIGLFAMILGLVALLIAAVGLAIAIKHQHPKGELISALVIASVGILFSFLQFSALGL